MAKMGRRRVIDVKKKRSILNSLRQGLTIKDALYLSGVKTPTFYRERERDTDFREEIEAAERFVEVAARSNIAMAIVKGKDIDLSKWWLQHKDTDFKPVPPNMQLVNNIGLTDQQMADMLKNVQEGMVVEQKYLQQKNE